MGCMHLLEMANFSESDGTQEPSVLVPRWFFMWYLLFITSAEKPASQRYTIIRGKQGALMCTLWIWALSSGGIWQIWGTGPPYPLPPPYCCALGNCDAVSEPWTEWLDASRHLGKVCYLQERENNSIYLIDFVLLFMMKKYQTYIKANRTKHTPSLRPQTIELWSTLPQPCPVYFAPPNWDINPEFYLYFSTS